MIETLDKALIRVAEKTYDNQKDIRQKNRQRRHQVEDLYGVEYTRQGGGGSPATFYVSISPDMVYLERFQFKLIIQPFVSTVSGGTAPATVRVNDKSLTVEEDGDGYKIDPNPHNHTTESHTHNVVSGVTLTPTTATDFRVYIEGVDVTPYLMAQYGEWISGQGVWPSIEIEHDYDILEVASDLAEEGRIADANKLLRSGYKAIEITSNALFQVTLTLYSKYSHMSR